MEETRMQSMRRKAIALTVMLALGSLSATATATGASAATPTPCDRLAAHPWDPERVGEPVYWNRIPTQKAVVVCRKAVEVDASPHNMFQYARALAKARRYDEAVDWLIRAAEAGYAQAEFSLGDSYEYGEGVPRDSDQAQFWYARAAEHGHEKARSRLSAW
jgi:TPR repeat protein